MIWNSLGKIFIYLFLNKYVWPHGEGEGEIRTTDLRLMSYGSRSIVCIRVK